MLYIFHVDTGTTITFDIKLALQSVSQLMEAIERECGVVAAHQVLLMSGGECLEPNARVCSYSAGTDTNPIYLFSKAAIENNLPPTPSIDYGSDVDLQTQIDNSLAMPATYQTLCSRAQLAQHCCNLAREQTRICEKLVHDQHLQQQGWAAVVANLEDITQMFQSRAEQFQQSFVLYLAERQQHMELLDNFSADLGTLAKIPILPALRAQAEGLLSPDDQPSQSSEPTLEDGGEVLSLLRWISAKDNQSSLEQVAEHCSRGLEQFNEQLMQALKAEVDAAIEQANKQDMKEIKGLGERLFALEQLMVQSKKLVHEQGELAQGFMQNQSRASNLGDPSILPDLCTSHRKQLVVMLQAHNQLRDIRRRCTKAKEELSVNIYHRLKWIMYVENKMVEVGNKLIIYHESLKRLRRHLEVLQQIHLAPEMYISAVVEVVRRRTFSQAFLVWASNLACQLMTVHSEELARRREFQNKFDGHFLNTLFPGLEDTPPPFATQAPSVFDNGLPKLTADDMESLRAQLPDLALTISTPDLNSITQFFLSKSFSEGSTDGNKEKDVTSVSTDIPKDQERTSRAPLLSDRGGFESETDTEEFEKIGQAGVDAGKPGVFDGAKQKRQKQLEENLGNTREEVERLRSILKTMKAVVCEELSSIRNELAVLRDQSKDDKNDVAEITERIRMALSLYSQEYDRNLQKREQEMAIEHEFKLSDLTKLMQSREEETCLLKHSLMEKESELVEHERLVTTMHQKLEDAQLESRNIQTRLHQQLEEYSRILTQARIDKEEAVKKTNDERFLEITSLTNSLTQCQKRIKELEDNLNTARSDQDRLVKEATDKFQLEYKAELETIRSRFKLMAASTMERSPSDSSLEKIERTDVIELANHEAIVAQVKEDMKQENAAALRTAIEKERNDCMGKLDTEMRWVKQVLEEKNREIETYKIKTAALINKGKRYQNMLDQLVGQLKTDIQPKLREKMQDIEADSAWLQNCCEEAVEKTIRELLEQNEIGVYSLESGVRKDSSYDQLDANQAGSGELFKDLEADIQVSESKKVRLEADKNDLVRLSRRLEALENDNKRLSSELNVIRASKIAAEAKVETLMTDKFRLEVELLKERTKKVISADLVPSESREKDMNASVAVVSDSSSSKDVATSPEPNRRPSSKSLCFHSPFPIYTQKKIEKTSKVAKMVQEGTVTITSCNPGDIVVVAWDTEHGNYAIYQQSSTLYFLHSDCTDVMERMCSQKYVLAEVIDKEYCHARKQENRYHVPLGTKFYRVRAKPRDGLDEAGAMSKSQLKDRRKRIDVE
ncbi:RB1-inducible coiled-coil protein 1 isoform X2 [Pseudomyrmex gracilis]|uniref:RB1-inducible coiled-coil protein 1 isoform X2 n=1 Tax=Pseudomyrmex gracilis TaxID=219809 RepID=UPI0009956BE0|nr:RB1-inducible coiled-coil protein 1 isoform X2 [Pseudomyrmex gracilis]